MMQQGSAEMASPLFTRAVLAARSTPLSGGAIAGAVVGSVIGASLILICILPFILRARRQRRNRYDDGSGQAEMGQSPGGPILPYHHQQDDISKTSPASHLVQQDPGVGHESGLINGNYSTTAQTGPGNDQYSKATSHQKPQQLSVLPPGVDVQQGLPSPISPTHPPSSRSDSSASKPIEDTQAHQVSATASPAIPPLQSRHGSVGGESNRGLSLTDSQGPPSRQLTGILPNGITEEPETLERTASSPRQNSLSHLPESIRNFIHRHHSGHRRRDSKRSTLGGTDGTRSPSVVTTDVPTQLDVTAPPIIEVNPQPRGLAWDYYNDPSLGVEYQDTSVPPAPINTSVSQPQPSHLAVVPPTHTLGSTLPSPVSPTHQGGFAPLMTTHPVVEEPEVISPDTDKTITPNDPRKALSRQESHFKRFNTLSRTDSLPAPTIVSDIIPSPPLQSEEFTLTGNPMDLMRPTNEAENAWMVNQEILKIENSPSPPPVVHFPAPSTLPPTDEQKYYEAGPSPEMESQMIPDLNIPDVQDVDGMPNYMRYMQFPDDVNNYVTSDISTPAPSTGPSVSTPDTRLTPYTASPSPRSDAPLPGSSPRPFACDQCNRSFDQVHKLK